MFGICWHKWTAWSKPVEVEVSILWKDAGTAVAQIRECKKCGKIDRRLI